ncbi:lysozyme [Methylomagnum ishizawai]|uniref:lysozyme n=1 Tax=Methylomagnum ishizawai TaxID=1760988 RepID=UPI001C336B20|nr:lysozyme [Methylomagnum ishizawai]BBL73967.1 hypothetical protein MishRS11D_10650 [Methylomagnum ishizawai]
MNAEMRLSANGLDAIMRMETFLSTWGLGKWGHAEIGYGHIKRQGDMVPDRLTKNEAKALLKDDCEIAAKNIRLYVKVALNQHQFDALVSLAFSLGQQKQSFAGCEVAKRLNDGDYAGAARAFGIYINDGLVACEYLIARRRAERALFEGR